jgi:hypothetical protein
VVEPTSDGREGEQSYRIRSALLAIVDCPYVCDIQNDIARYASASELHLILKENKS